MPNEPSSHVVPDEQVSPAPDASAPAGSSNGENAACNASTSDPQKTVISQRPPVSPPAFRRAANPFEMGDALEGEQLGHFLLEQFVGGGGMGAVFRATDTMLGRTVAVKVVSRDQTNEDTLRRFRNEAQSAARLDHPNIARVYYVGEDKGWNYIVLEYIEGINVRDLVEHEGPLALEDAISYTLQIAEALEHASQREVTHRDIKPSNILIMIDGKAKLVDMGLARLQQVESSTDDLTASGVTLGTFDYISPEQARDPRNTDVRSDLYSLGCTLYFMLTGLPPFPDGTVLQKLLSHSVDKPADVREYRPDLDESLVNIVERLLAKQPDERFQSPRDLIGALLLAAERLDLPGIRAQTSVWITHTDQQLTWWIRHLPWVASLVALGIVVALFGWLNSAEQVGVPTPRFARSAVGDPEGPVTSDAAREAGNNSSPAGSATNSTALPPPTGPNETTSASPPAPKLRTDGSPPADDDTARSGNQRPRRVQGRMPCQAPARAGRRHRAPTRLHPPKPPIRPQPTTIRPAPRPRSRHQRRRHRPPSEICALW